jgi:dipeptidyl-peptidase-4
MRIREIQPMSRSLRTLAFLVAALLSVPTLAQQKEGAAPLTVQRIFGASEFQPEHLAIQWLADSSGYVALEPSSDARGGRDLVSHDPASGDRRVLVSAADLTPPNESPLAIDEYAFSKDRSRLLVFTNTRRVWRANTRGDYWVLDRASRELRKLGGDAPPSSLMHAKFAPSGLEIAYVRQNDIYLEDLIDHQIKKLTNSRSADEINGTFDWVYEEEFSLRDGFRFSPDGKWIAYWRLDTTGVPEFPLVNNTDSLYPRITSVKYPKVGEKNAECRVGIVSTAGGSTEWIAVTGDPRDNYIAYLEWAGNSHEVVLQRFNRRQNTVAVMLAETPRDESSGYGTSSLAPYAVAPAAPSVPANLNARTIFEDHDAAWIDLQEHIHWIHDGQEFLWLSERDGWRHLYRVSRDGKNVKPVTSGEFDVIELLAVDPASDSVYFTASPKNPTQRYLYRVNLAGSGLERISPAGQSGTHDYQISPDAKWAIDRFSAFDVIPKTALVRLPKHETVRMLSENKDLHVKLDGIEKGRSEFFRVDIGDGVSLDAWCLFPPGFDSSAKYPLLVYVYGEPAGQTVLDRWGGPNHLWHRMLAQNGYVVMSFDNRGTPSPRGRAWRKSVFQQVGILAPKDQAAAVKEVLRLRPYLDKDRIGIWGWSGGGSMTLNAILKYPDLYKTAIAVAPVANQRYYDTIYQERYMGLPGDNVEGFRQGSPVNFAHQLKGNLLLIHGTGDDNCHYQGTEALINELIRHNKPFTMMAYPNRSHGIFEGPNTTLHLRELMTRYLKQNLPPGPIRGSREGTKAN